MRKLWLTLMVMAGMGGIVQGDTELYKDTSQPTDKRVADLVSRMTLEEKVGLMVSGWTNGAAGIERLGIAPYHWWSEALHGIARAGVATVFPQAIGMAASFDEKLMYDTATIISTEGRAKHHEFVRRNDRGRDKGLTFWSPNINIFRDPRWGRGQETYGEDPFLTSRMGVAFIRGMQGDHPRYLKTAAGAKHYAVHSGPEPKRHYFDAVVSDRDLHETYLRAFKAAVMEADVEIVMAAYNRVNGIPCAANRLLLTGILREDWGFDGHVVSDCWGLIDLHSGHKFTSRPAESAAVAVKSGLDCNCGSVIPRLITAVELGLIDEPTIDVAVSRLMRTRMRLGMFDPPEDVPFTQIPYQINDCPAHDRAALRMARASMVLLKNEDKLLPLRKKKLQQIAVIGPNADRIEPLLGNYHGTPSHPVTFLAGIREKAGDDIKVVYDIGCDLVEGFGLIGKETPVPADTLRSADGHKGLTGSYYNNTKFEGKPTLTRVDATIQFEWGKSSPTDDMAARGMIDEKNTIKPDYFSVRWEGTITAPVTGAYRVGVRGDDGFSLYIDGKRVVHDWREMAARSVSAAVEMDAGKAYSIRLDYFESGGDASVKLFWAKPTDMEHEEKAVELAQESDIVVFVGGITAELEGEQKKITYPGFLGGDKVNLQLPGTQQKLIRQLHETGKPVIFVMTTGSALAINEAQEKLPAIINAWYPGQRGGTALADILFGDYNPAGRLPITFYKSVEQLPSFDDYNMNGKTYRFFEDEVLYEFGYGLSYTSFTYANLRFSRMSIKPDETVEVRVDVSNTGKMAGDEVVQLYVTDTKASVPVPNLHLEGFERIHLTPGEIKTVTFTLEPENLAAYDNRGEPFVEAGDFRIFVGGSQHHGIAGMLKVAQ